MNIPIGTENDPLAPWNIDPIINPCEVCGEESLSDYDYQFCSDTCSEK